jgi:tetratricopeptide (TPR) repeat protein
MKLFLIILCFFLLFPYCLSQKTTTNPDTISPTMKHYYQLLMQEMGKEKWSLAQKYADTLAIYSREAGSDKFVIVGNLLKGQAIQSSGNLSKALEQYYYCLELNNEFNYITKVTGRLYRNFATIYYELENKDSTLFFVQKMLDLPCARFSVPVKDYATTLLLDMNEIKKALIETKKALVCAKEQDIPSYRYTLYHKISKIYLDVGDYELAFNYIDSSLAVSVELQDTMGMIVNYDNLGLANMRIDNYRQALEWFQKEVVLAEKISERGLVYDNGDFETLINLGWYYARVAETYDHLLQLDSAIYFSEKALMAYHQSSKHRDIGYVEYNDVPMQLTKTASLLIQKGNYQAALDLLEKAYTMAPRQEKWLQFQYYFYLSKGMALKGQKQYRAAESNYEMAERLALELDESSKLITLYEEWMQLATIQKKYKEVIKYQKLYTEHQEAIYEFEKQNTVLRYEIKYETEQVKQENIVLAKERDIQQLKAERNQQLVYGAGVFLVFIVIIFILLILQFRTKAIFLTQKLKYQLLRNQMNPHFIFNSLTAIQSFVYKKNPIEAGEYIASFAELMRAILDNSEEEYISLNKEIEWLENYLKLQLLRFGNQFDYTLRLDPQIDLEDTMIPPMLTQPFIENALEHGLKDIDYKGHLDINIKVHNKSLEIDVLDNGIGLEESKKNNQDKKHKSRATQITQERLMFLNKKQSKNINLSIQPNKGKGTKISFTIPFISQF